MQTFLTYTAVLLAGAAGVGARMSLGTWIAQRFGETFPLNTLVINILGSFAIGLVAGLTNPDNGLLTSPIVRQAIMIGFLGGFTTFSSFSLQTINLMQTGEFLYAAMNIILSVVLCLIGCWLGMVAANIILARHL